MVDLSPTPVKKDMSMYEIKGSVDMIDERIKELLRHRGEVACGDYEWDCEVSKKEYFRLLKVRDRLRSLVIDRATKAMGL